MAKFKIGDHVELLPYSDGLTYDNGHEGETATVMEAYHIPDIKLDYPCTIHKDGECRVTCWDQAYLELV